MIENQKNIVKKEQSIVSNPLVVIPHIIDQHAEEAAFLWLLRNNAVYAPHYDLNDLSTLDERVEAHLDGLRIAGDHGWQACCENLQFKESGEVFTAAVLALEGQSHERINLVFKVVEEAPEAINGLVSAFGWVDPNHLQGKVKELLESEKPLWRRIGLSACAIHRIDPGIFLQTALRDENLQLRARALKAVGELGRVDLNSVLLEQLNHKNKHIRFWAAWSAVLTGDRGPALHLLIEEIESNSEYCISAMRLAIPVLNRQITRKTLKVLVDDKETLRQGIIGVGLSGDPHYIPWLIQQMDMSEHAKVAGEAFHNICGLEIADLEMETEFSDSVTGPSENPDDEDVAMDPDEDLSCPDALLVQKWWQENTHHFKADVSYIYGKPCNESQCKWLLTHASQKLRNIAAIMLALMHPNLALFEVRAVGKKQQKVIRNEGLITS